MAITVKCAGCGKTLKVKDDMAGKRGKCPECGMSIVVAVPADGVASPATTGAESRQPGTVSTGSGVQAAGERSSDPDAVSAAPDPGSDQDREQQHMEAEQTTRKTGPRKRIVLVVAAGLLVCAVAVVLTLALPSSSTPKRSDLPNLERAVDELNKLAVAFEVGIEYRDFMPAYREFVVACRDLESSGEAFGMPEQLVSSHLTPSRNAWEFVVVCSESEDIERLCAESGVAPETQQIALNVYAAAAGLDWYVDRWQRKIEEPATFWKLGGDERLQTAIAFICARADEADGLFHAMEP